MFGLCKNIFREFEREPELPGYRGHLGAYFAGFPEHFKDMPFRIKMTRSPFIDDCHDFLSRPRAHRFSFRYVDVASDTFLIGGDKEEVLAFFKRPNDGFLTSFNNLDNLAFGKALKWFFVCRH